MWSIGIYQGRSPLDLQACGHNPVLTSAMVTDVPAEFVADPFMISHRGSWFLFCEVFNGFTCKGEIALAQSLDGLRWRYHGVVLRDPYHLSYPCVFPWGDSIFMIPETFAAEAVRLYRADPFPDRWSFLGDLVQGAHADATFLAHDGHCYLFACRKPHQQETLSLYHAELPAGPWLPHPCSPVVREDRRRARPAGRIVSWHGHLLRFAQDCVPVYGSRVRAFQITELTPTTYRECECPGGPVLAGSGLGWNAARMHHLDPHPVAENQWLACVDGFSQYEQGTLP